jgi:hypothetical protein
MRQLERERHRLDDMAHDIEDALSIREGTIRGSDSLMGRRYADAARAVSDVNAILDGGPTRGPATECAKDLAGRDVLIAHGRTSEVLRNAIGERFEASVRQGDVVGLSELTPLLGMLDMAELGVRLYLQYSQSVLCRNMDADVDDMSSADGAAIDVTNVPREEGMSRAAMRRRAEEERKRRQNDVSVPSRLARIYNAAVTHLRHHLPMVAHALGDADGDAALVQLVHVEAEKRVVDILRDHMARRELGRTVRRAEIVATKVENRYTAGGGSGGGGGGGGGGQDGDEGLFGMDDTNIANVIMGLGAGGDVLDVASRRNAAQREDCGFTIEVGNLPDVDAALEEWALVMQHTESYERFVRHAVDEVIKARGIRRAQKREEKRRLREMAESKSEDRDPSSMLESGGLSTPRGKKNASAVEQESDLEDRLEIMPPHTALNEVAAEIGGYYSSLERCLLLAAMQRAFIHANFPDDSTFTYVSIGNENTGSIYQAMAPSGSRALQTTLVDECLFAARRSTLRSFATGHTGVASAAANGCVDMLGRILLDVLTRRADLGTRMLKPGDGLLDGQYGLGQAALSFAKSTAGKGFRGARAGARVGDVNDATAEAMRQRTSIGVARAVASFNDLEVVADYTKRLEANFLKEIDAGYPRVHATEQLRMCVKGLSGVVESFARASNKAVEELIVILLPRARQIVNDSVGQDGSSSSAASNFLGTPVLAVGNTSAKVVFDYNMDDAAFELSQISEGYIGRM